MDPVPGRLRRDHRRRQPQEPVHHVAHGRAAQVDLGAGEQGQDLEGRRCLVRPDRKIVLYSPDKDSGTFEFFTEAIVGKAKRQREDVQASSDDNILVKGVAGDPDGLGYFGYAYYFANKDKLRAVLIQQRARMPNRLQPQPRNDPRQSPTRPRSRGRCTSM